MSDRSSIKLYSVRSFGITAEGERMPHGIGALSTWLTWYLYTCRVGFESYRGHLAIDQPSPQKGSQPKRRVIVSVWIRVVQHERAPVRNQNHPWEISVVDSRRWKKGPKVEWCHAR